MSDQPKMQGSVVPLMFTGIASATGGDSLGESLSDIVVWIASLWCHCTPPTAVASAFRVICTALVVTLAFLVHYFILKKNQPTQ